MQCGTDSLHGLLNYIKQDGMASMLLNHDQKCILYIAADSLCQVVREKSELLCDFSSLLVVFFASGSTHSQDAINQHSVQHSMFNCWT